MRAGTRKRKTRIRQKGGEVLIFRLYVFTKSSIPPHIKQRLFECLERLYGKVPKENMYTGIRDQNHGRHFLRNIMKESVYPKGGHYRHLHVITELSVKPIPPALKRRPMSDEKLQEQSDILQLSLEEDQLPFKVVPGLSNLWSEEMAIIALEPDT